VAAKSSRFHFPVWVIEAGVMSNGLSGKINAEFLMNLWKCRRPSYVVFANSVNLDIHGIEFVFRIHERLPNFRARTVVKLGQADLADTRERRISCLEVKRHESAWWSFGGEVVNCKDPTAEPWAFCGDVAWAYTSSNSPINARYPADVPGYPGRAVDDGDCLKSLKNPRRHVSEPITFPEL
jgi:hypothetical protein